VCGRAARALEVEDGGVHFSEEVEWRELSVAAGGGGVGSGWTSGDDSSRAVLNSLQ
jgi:hypothetical protein